jgi:glycyl-tRNA synthetase
VPALPSSFEGRELRADIPAEAARSVLAERGDNPALAVSSSKELAAELASGAASALPDVLRALSRPTRLIRGKPNDEEACVDEALFECEEERALLAAFRAAQRSVMSDMSVRKWLEVASGIVAPVDAFFEHVFVMAEDERVRRNRFALVRDVARLPASVLDLAELPGF